MYFSGLGNVTEGIEAIFEVFYSFTIFLKAFIPIALLQFAMCYSWVAGMYDAVTQFDQLVFIGISLVIKHPNI